MTLRTLTAATLGLVLATGVLAVTLPAGTARPPGVATPSIGAVLGWLEEPVRRALADATDPRPRK